jgi:hypothetical protein
MMMAEALMVERICFSETLASTDESTRRQNPDHHHHHPHRCENLISHYSFIFNDVRVFTAHGTFLYVAER